VPST
jgi:hypothetical protein